MWGNHHTAGQKSRPGASCALPPIEKEKQIRRLEKWVDPASCYALGLAPSLFLAEKESGAVGC